MPAGDACSHDLIPQADGLLRGNGVGQWNEAAKTLSYRADLEDEKTTRSSVRFADPNKEVWQFQVTAAAGEVYFDMDITATRRLGE